MAAAAIWPGWPRTSCTRASNGESLPLAASSDNAPETMPASSKRSAMNRPCSARPVETWVPLISARPSFAASTTGAMPACWSASVAGIITPLKRTSPTPMMASVMCDSGARSPDAPTEPLAGIAGMMPALYSAISVSMISGRTPEKPRARLPIFISDQADHFIAQQRAGADGMRQDQIALQLLQLFIRDAGLGQQAEAGVDAVGRVAFRDDGAHRGGGCFDDRIGVGVQRQMARRDPHGAQFGQSHCARFQGPGIVQMLSHIFFLNYLIIGRFSLLRLAHATAVSYPASA